MLKERYQYPVIVTEEDDIFYVEFPGFDVNSTYGETMESAIIAAQECLSLLIQDFESEGHEPPAPVSLSDVQLKTNQRVLWLDLWMPLYRAETRIEYKKKTLTIPAWLDILAAKKNINFSQVLTEGLKRELGISAKQP